MGLYDTVYMRCTNCGNKMGIQSKAGECDLNEYQLHDVPPAIAGSLVGEVIKCENCGQTHLVRGHVYLNLFAVDDDELEF